MFEKFEWSGEVFLGVGCGFFVFRVCGDRVYIGDWGGVCVFCGFGCVSGVVDVVGYVWVKWSWVVLFVKNVYWIVVLCFCGVGGDGLYLV